MFTRQRQDFLTWLLAVVLLLSQITPWVPVRPDIVGAAVGLLGLPVIRKAQDGVTKDKEPEPQP